MHISLNMKPIQSLLLLSLILLLSSCFIADDAFGVQKAPKTTFKQKSQAVITNYIKSKSINEKYFSYGYSDLIIHKPEALIELDSLKNQRKNKSANQTIVEADITRQEKIIKDNQIRYTMEMDHVFSLTDKKTGDIQLFETRFFIADSLKVYDTKLLLNIPLTKDDEIIFADYFYETTIFVATDYYEARTLSKQFYSFLKFHLEELNTIKEKSDFLIHILWLCKEVKTTGSFNQQLVLQKMASRKLKFGKFFEYESIKFSTLYEINEGENLNGYYFFHKFSHFNKNKEEIAVVYISFSPYFELKEIRMVEPPYKPYFNE